MSTLQEAGWAAGSKVLYCPGSDGAPSLPFSLHPGLLVVAGGVHIRRSP